MDLLDNPCQNIDKLGLRTQTVGAVDDPLAHCTLSPWRPPNARNRGKKLNRHPAPGKWSEPRGGSPRPGPTRPLALAPLMGTPGRAPAAPSTTLFVEAARDFVRLAERVSDVRARIPMSTEPRSPQHDADEPPFPASTLAALRSPVQARKPEPLPNKPPERANALSQRLPAAEYGASGD